MSAVTDGRKKIRAGSLKCDMVNMKPADAAAAIPQVRSMMANLSTIRELGRQLDASYAQALKEQ